MLNVLFILLAFLLVLLNGFFVAAEFGMVKLRHTRVLAIKKKFGFRGKILFAIHTNLDAYLSACQLGITLTSLGLGWIGEPAFASLLGPVLNQMGIFSPTTISATSFVIAFLFISYLHIVIGELAPKSLAIRQAQIVSLWTAIPLYLFYWTMYPFIWLLNQSANSILRLSRVKQISDSDHGYTSDELKLILTGGHLHSEIAREEVEILDNVLDFAELKVADIMRPAEEMVAISLKAPFSEILQAMAANRYSRYPVYEEDPKHIKGIIHVKDVFAAMQSKQEKFIDLAGLMRSILVVNTDRYITELYRQFRAGLTHFAIVVNLNGDLVGFVTLDNILSALLGEIKDEFVKPKTDWVLTPDGAMLMKGSTPLYVIEKALSIELPDLEANTVAGLILFKLERMPKNKEVIPFEHFDIEVVKIKGPRILLVKIFPHIAKIT